MNYYTRKQVMELLEIDEGFLVALEREEIVARDAPPDTQGEFSERMLERARVAQNLVNDLEVNLPLRNNPLERRKLQEIGPLAGRLMSLLKVGEDSELH